MAGIDTANKRFSMIEMASPIITMLPVPDGSFPAGDRPQLLKLYAAYAPTGGSVFDYEYNLAATYHVFLNKGHTKRLVMPNYVTVSTPLGADVAYTGSASHPDSALRRMDYFVTLAVTSNAQAQAIAAALISHFAMDSEKGYAEVPMNVGQEIYDYIKITDSRQGDYRIGNVTHIKRHYEPGKFGMIVYMGTVAAGDTSLSQFGAGGGGGGGGNQQLGNIEIDTLNVKRLYVWERLKIPTIVDAYD